jgi:hypothetical protein
MDISSISLSVNVPYRDGIKRLSKRLLLRCSQKNYGKR